MNATQTQPAVSPAKPAVGNRRMKLTFTREPVNYGADDVIGTMTVSREEAEAVLLACGADRAWMNWGRKGQTNVLFKSVTSKACWAGV